MRPVRKHTVVSGFWALKGKRAWEYLAASSALAARPLPAKPTGTLAPPPRGWQRQRCCAPKQARTAWFCTCWLGRQYCVALFVIVECASAASKLIERLQYPDANQRGFSGTLAFLLMHTCVSGMPELQVAAAMCYILPRCSGCMGAQQHQLSYSCADAGSKAWFHHDEREQAVEAVMGLHKVSCASITTLRAAL